MLLLEVILNLYYLRLVQFEVDGSATVSVRYAGTKLDQVANVLAGVGLVLWLGVVAFDVVESRREKCILRS